MAKKLILIPSDLMDNNKKPDRNENALIRMSARVRQHMGFDQENVELWQTRDQPMLLNIFKAYSADIKAAKESGEYDEEQLERVAFVTSSTFSKLTGKRAGVARNIWVSDSVESVVFGTDPEFLLFDKEANEIIHANNVLNFVGSMGCDGAMAEVRPIPTTNVEALIDNIVSILTDAEYRNVLDRYNLVASCYYKNALRDYPVGGHIHIGNPAKVLEIDFPNREYIFKTMNKIMDELVAVPMIKFDGPIGKTRRTNCIMSKTGGYGYFGEYRLAPERPVKMRRLEHRTLSGMWMMHPILAKAVLGTAKAVIDEMWRLIADRKFDPNYAFPEEFRKNGVRVWKAEFDGWKNMELCKDMGCTTSSAEIIKKLNSDTVGCIDKKFLDSWLSKMKRLESYKDNSKYIDALYEILRYPIKEIEKLDKVIQHNWIEGKKFLVNF